MMEIRFDRGVHLPGPGLWLDPQGPKDLAFVSHAHSDHTGKHAEAILTSATSRLMAARTGPSKGIEHLLAYHEPFLHRNFEITLVPAGHVLGSAQCLIRYDGESLLYTGDFKLRAGLSSEPARAVPADTLIMETTFGRPHYVFPAAAEVLARVVKFCYETLEDGDVPVLLGYSLGKAQEILAALTTAGIPIMLHGSVAKITGVYADLGIVFPPFVRYRADQTAGHCVICPPSVNGSAMLQKIRRRRVAVLTGWAMDAAAIHRLRCDAAFPLSDHADYPDLLRHVADVAPKRVLTLHGFAQDFARDLRARGIEAWALTGANQLELMLPGTSRSVSGATLLAGDFQDHMVGAFEAFASLTESVAQSTGKLVKVRLVSDFLRSLDGADLASAATWLTGHPFSRASERVLQLGSALIRRALLAVSGCTPSEYQTVSRRFNDAGLTTREILKDRSNPCSLSLAEVLADFNRLELARGPLAKQSVLEEILRHHSATSAMAFVKILTGDLRIGLKEGLVEDAIAMAFEAEADAVREAHMLLGDLGATARHAKDSSLVSVGLVPFQPIRAMLASPEPDGAAIWKRFVENAENPAAVSLWIEDKFDGIRAQIHVVGGRAEIFSRDLRRITATFPEIVTAAAEIGDCVMDGEIVAFSSGRALGFFDLQKRLGRREPDLFLREDVPVRFVAFDLLWLRGESLFRYPMIERRAALDSLELSDPLECAEVHSANSAEAIDIEFLAARQRGREGLMIKDPRSAYLPGRRGIAWVKLKKVSATLDVVVVAVEYGHGRRNQVLSDYTFAVRAENGGLVTIGKAYSGLTDAEIQGLTTRFLKLVRGQRGRVLDVDPVVVLEVAFDSIQPSTRHPSGYALRFPRIHRIRDDKSADEIDSLATAARLALGSEP